MLEIARAAAYTNGGRAGARRTPRMAWGNPRGDPIALYVLPSPAFEGFFWDDERRVVVQTCPRSSFVVIETKQPFAFLRITLDADSVSRGGFQ